MGCHFYVITGPSACGKTTLLKQGKDKGFWEVAKKYSTREPRKGDGAFDDIDYMSKEDIYASIIIDYRYIMNDYIYAFSSEQILETILGNSGSQPSNVAIVCSDLGTIRKLKQDKNLNKYLVVLFISTVPATKQVTKAWLTRESSKALAKKEKKRHNFDILNKHACRLSVRVDKYYNYQTGNNDCQSFESFSDTLQAVYEEYVEQMPESFSYKSRIRNIDKFYYKYVEEIVFFDYTILNFFDPANEGDIRNEKMTHQVKSIIDYLNTMEHDAPVQREYSNNALFFICAPKRSGKAILFSNLNLMSRDKVEIVRKIALRENKNTDADLASGKGDGLGLSETYWMFDSINDPEYTNFQKLKQAAGADESNWHNHAPLQEKIHELLDKASERVNTLIIKQLSPAQIQNQVHNFTEWHWLFQGNYYAVDTATFTTSKKHSIVISNIDQIEEARKWADKAKKIFVPIFLVYVDHEENSKMFHTGKNIKKTIDGEIINKKIFETINDYYENIGKFRHVILNNGIAEDVHDQISNIIGQYKYTGEFN